MKKISDFNSATEKYPVVYAGSATRPEFVDMPTTLQQQEGVAPMDTLPAQWWNAMWKLATKDINAFRDYVGDAFTEINNLLTEFGITLDDADTEQLYNFFHDDYVQNYLKGIFVDKSGDTIDGDLHIKGDLTVDGVGEEIISTELKVGANTITLRNDNPSALGNTELAGVVTENYDGNNHNNIIAIDKNGVARTGDVDIATRILYSNDGTNFYTDEDLTIPATIGATEEVRDTGNQTSGGVEIYEGVTYSNDDTQAIATREDNPVDGAFMKWDAATKKLVSASSSIQFDIAWPIGVTYTQYPGQKSPNELWSQYSTWEELNYGGAFFRCAGGNASNFEASKVVTAINGTTITIADHGLVVGSVLYDKNHNEARLVSSVTDANRVVVNAAFSSSSITSLLISQNNQNLSHSHSETSAGSHTHTTNTLTNSSGTAITKTGDQDTSHTHDMQHYHTKGDMRIQGSTKGVQYIHEQTQSGCIIVTPLGQTSAWSGNSDKQYSQITIDTNAGGWSGKTSNSQDSSGNAKNSTGNQSASHAHNFEHKHTTDSRGGHTHTINASGGTESRPFNFTKKIWVRTA